MGKIIEFKKFSRKINKDNLYINNCAIDMFPESEEAYFRKEISINLNEIDYLLNCVNKQMLINDKLIHNAEKVSDFEKATYLKDFNDKLYDIMYFLTNSVYGEPIIIKLNFLELKYLLGTLQIQLEITNESKELSEEDYFIKLEKLSHRLYSIYNEWEKEI